MDERISINKKTTEGSGNIYNEAPNLENAAKAQELNNLALTEEITLEEVKAIYEGLINSEVSEDKIPQLLKGFGAKENVINEFYDTLKNPSINREEKKIESPKTNEPKINTSSIGFFEAPTFDIDLPSRGYFYPNNQSVIKMKNLSASEDDILYSTDLVMKNEQLDAILDACIQDKNISGNDLLTGDRNFLLIYLRKTGLGNLYKPGIMTCNGCGGYYSPEVDLSKLTPKTLEHTPDEKGYYSLSLPESKVDIKFRFLTGSDEKILKGFGMKLVNVKGHKLAKTLTEKYLLHIMELNGQTDKLYIKSFVAAMPMQDSALLRRYIAAIEPGINLNYNFECPHCQHQEEKPIPINSKLFYPEFDEE